MKLYDLPRGAKIIDCECTDGSKYIIFEHVDGMYSYCTTEKGAIIHLAAMCPMRKVRGRLNEYRINEKQAKKTLDKKSK